MSNGSTFDPDIEFLGTEWMKGECLRFEVKDPAGGPTLSPPMVPNRVLDPTRPFNIELDWQIRGGFSAPWLIALGGNWLVSVFAESIGPGPELQIASAAVPVGAVSGFVHNYSAVMTVPASTLDEHTPPVRSGVYKLIATVFLNSNISGGIGYDICGFCDGGMIKVENPQ